METHLLLLFALTILPAVILPGPNSAYCVAQSLKYGLRKAMLAPLGFATGRLIHVTLVFSGLGMILSRYSGVFTFIKWMGVVYLFWMAWKAFRDSSDLALEAKGEAIPAKIYGRAIFVSLTNPKAILVNSMVLPVFIDANELFLPQAISLGLVAIAITFTVYTLYVLLASKIANKLRRSKNSNRVVGTIYIGAGVALATVNR